MNNAVYKTGFATTQAAYDENVTNLFNMLQKLEDLLSGQNQSNEPRDYLCGPGKGEFTEADLRYVVFKRIVQLLVINPVLLRL